MRRDLGGGGSINALDAEANTVMSARLLKDEGIGRMVTVCIQVAVSIRGVIIIIILCWRGISVPSTIRDSHDASDEAQVCRFIDRMVACELILSSINKARRLGHRGFSWR